MPNVPGFLYVLGAILVILAILALVGVHVHLG